MTELSNAVTVLIARMESHPEDFELYSSRKGKFSQTAEALYGLVGMDAAKAGAYWFLADADKEALIEAWKKYHRARMEKEVMEKIFDDGQAEREAEMERQQQQRAHINAQMARIGAAQQLQPLPQSAQNTGGLIGSSYPYMANSAQNSTVQPWQNATNAAQNSTGITTNSRGFLSGVFK